MKESYHDYIGRMLRTDRQKTRLRAKINKHYYKIHQLQEKLKKIDEQA